MRYRGPIPQHVKDARWLRKAVILHSKAFTAHHFYNDCYIIGLPSIYVAHTHNGFVWYKMAIDIV